MNRILTIALAIAPSALGLVVAPPVQAVGTGLPTIQNPVDGTVFQPGDNIAFDVDFSDAPAGTYQLLVQSPGGAPFYEQSWENPNPNPIDGDVASFSLSPDEPGNYTFTVSDGTQVVAYVGFTRYAPPPPPPPPPPAPAAKRPLAPRSAHTTVASKKVRLYWAAPASTGGAAVTGYQLKVGASVRNLSAGYRSLLFTGLKNKRLYSFYVRAKNRVGYSAWAHAYGKPRKPKKIKHKRPKHHGAAAQGFANCDAMHRVYPHGVGLPRAVDNGGVTNFYRSAAIYNKNKKSDRDKDGVACEA